MSQRQQRTGTSFTALLLSGLIALLAAAATLALGWREPQQFFRSYLFAYTFWLGLPLGALVFALIHPLVGGSWGLMLRPALLLCLRTMPILALLFLPLACGFSYLYGWASATPGGASEALLAHRAAYMNPTFVTVRAAGFLVLWSALAVVLARWTERYDPSAGAAPNRLRGAAAAGLVLLFLTSSAASVDWLMSLETNYYSTIYGLICLSGQALLALAFGIAWTAASGTSLAAEPKQWRDLGSLLATNVLLWAYLQYSQLIINWSGNGANEISWYLHRIRLGWEPVSAALIVLNFAAPFFILLFRRVKDNGRALGLVALGLVGVHVLDIYWLVTPSFGLGALASLHPLDALAFLTIGGTWTTTALLLHRFSADQKRTPQLLRGTP